MKPNKKLLLIAAAIAAFQSGLLFAQVDDEASLDSLISQFAQEDSEFCEMNIQDAERQARQLALPYNSEVATLSQLGSQALTTWHRNLTKAEGEGEYQHASRQFDVSNLASQLNEASRTSRRKAQLELAIELEQQLRTNNAERAQTQANEANAGITRTVQEKTAAIAALDAQINALSTSGIYSTVNARVVAVEGEIEARRASLFNSGILVSLAEISSQGRNLNRFMTRVCNQISNGNRREQTNLRNACKASIRYIANTYPGYQQMFQMIAPTRTNIAALNAQKETLAHEIAGLNETIVTNTAQVEVVRNAPTDQRVAIAQRRLPVYASRIRSIENSVYSTLGLSVERNANGRVSRTSYLPGSYLERLNNLASASCAANDRVITHNGRRQILSDSINLPNPIPANVRQTSRNCNSQSSSSDYEIAVGIAEGRVGICQKMSVSQSPVQGVTGYKLCSSVSIVDLGNENIVPTVTHQVKWFGAAGIIDVVEHNLDNQCRLYRRGRVLQGAIEVQLAPAPAAAPAASAEAPVAAPATASAAE